MATKVPAKKVRVTAKDVQAQRVRATKDFSPSWEGSEQWSGDRFSAAFRDAMKWYNLESSGRALKPQVLTWMAKAGYTKSQISAFKKTKDSRCGTTMGAIAACLLKGMPAVHPGFNKGRDTTLWLGAEIAKVIESGKHDVDDSVADSATPAVPVPSIQDRVRDSATLMMEELEDAFDNFHRDPESFDPRAFKVLNLLRGKGVKSAHARIIKDRYAKELAELTELASGTAESQLREGYSHRSRKQIKNLISFHQEIESACNMLMQEAKASRKPRVAKAVSKDKLISKLNYKKQDEVYKLVSVNPVEIIGSKELWVFNTKTRKLGKYQAAEFQELSVKGTSITGFDEAKSICKTLRKPADQLKEFKAAGKVALRKFLDTVSAVDSRMNGRISEDVILLKVGV